MKDTSVLQQSLLDGADSARMLPLSRRATLVDGVIECSPPQFIRTRRLLRAGEPALAHHEPDCPDIWPGAMLIELIRQSACLLAAYCERTQPGAEKLSKLTRCDAQFLSPVEAGSVLIAEVMLDEVDDGFALYEATVSSGGKWVCRARILLQDGK